MTHLRLSLALAAVLPLVACTTAPISPVADGSHATAAPDASQSQQNVPKLLLISIDGLRADALDGQLTPNMQRLFQAGVRARWMTPSYPSLTFPNHYTIVTGLRPDHHGIVHNTMQDEALGRFTLSDRDAVSNPGWWGGEPIWVSAEKAGVRTATWSWPGSETEIKGIRPSQWQHYDGTIAFEARVSQVMGWLTRTDADAPRLATLYMENVDKAGHQYGPDSQQYRDAVVRADTVVGQVLDQLDQTGLAASTNVVLVSDHGMASVPEGQVVAIEDMASPQVAKAISVGQSVGFDPLPGQQAAAEQALLGRHTHYQCWNKGNLPPRWHYGTHPRIPAIICQMDEGWDALPKASIAKRAPQDRGSHGYDNALPSMRAVFIARGPSFHQGQVIDGFDNVDVYPLLAHLLQVPAAPNDGDIQSLLPALKP